MTTNDILRYRLLNQQIAATHFTKPQEIVSWLVAMQAQEYAHAKWAIGLRLAGIEEAAVEKALNEGVILRTHLMRPTWHFVSPADIRWLLALTAPRVHAVNAYMYRKSELDNDILKKCNDVLIKTLQGGKHLTRISLKSALEAANIYADGFRLSYIMMQAELEGIICSGAREGKQFTYALLEERVPKVPILSREEALATFTFRYFTSRGPATLQDFVWWSGLTLKDAKAGVAMLPAHFEQQTIEGQTYIFAPMELKDLDSFQTTFLMPDYEEYGMSYKDRSALFIANNTDSEHSVNTTPYSHMLIIDGQIGGIWKQSIKKNTITLETIPFTILNKMQQEAVRNAEKRYSFFVGKSLEKKDVDSVKINDSDDPTISNK